MTTTNRPNEITYTIVNDFLTIVTEPTGRHGYSVFKIYRDVDETLVTQPQHAATQQEADELVRHIILASLAH